MPTLNNRALMFRDCRPSTSNVSSGSALLCGVCVGCDRRETPRQLKWSRSVNSTCKTRSCISARKLCVRQTAGNGHGHVADVIVPAGEATAPTNAKGFQSAPTRARRCVHATWSTQCVPVLTTGAAWRQYETHRVKSQGLDPQEQHRQLEELLHKEIQLLQAIDRCGAEG